MSVLPASPQGPPVEQVQAFARMYAPTVEVMAYLAAFNAGALPPTKANLECEEYLRATILKKMHRQTSGGNTISASAPRLQ